jgi:hypothetical protein
VGGSGTGKSGVAERIGHERGLPVFHLDDIEFERPSGERRPDDALDRALRAVLECPERVTEGIQLGWTDGLLRDADAIVWLDHLSPSAARRRIVRRFVAGAVRGVRRHQGRARFARLGDYRREVARLVRAMGETGSYHRPGGGEPSTASRAATASALAPHLDRVIHCRTAADVARLLADGDGA